MWKKAVFSTFPAFPTFPAYRPSPPKKRERKERPYAVMKNESLCLGDETPLFFFFVCLGLVGKVGKAGASLGVIIQE
jgi:hypothetical protein